MTHKPSKKELLMDAAEQLIALNGYHGVSVREITAAAEQRLASVNYYFGTKEELYAELIKRRGEVITLERIRRLDKIDFSTLTDHQAIEQICHAVVDPLFEKVMTGDPGWRAFYSVVAVLAENDLTKSKKIRVVDEYKDAMLQFVYALQKYAVNNDENKAYSAFQCLTSMGVLVFANNGRINTLSDDKYRSDDYESLYDSGIDFIIGGVTALLLQE